MECINNVDRVGPYARDNDMFPSHHVNYNIIVPSIIHEVDLTLEIPSSFDKHKKPKGIILTPSP